MASTKIANENVKASYLALVSEALTNKEEEVLKVGSNEIAIPVVNENGDDIFVVFKVSVPTGSRDGEAYDGYELAAEYVRKCEEKAEKAKAQAEAKAKKIAKDKANREKLAKSKAEHSAQ